MSSHRSLPGNDNNPLPPPDTRIFLLLAVCAGIVFCPGWNIRPDGGLQSGAARYELEWLDNRLILATRDDGSRTRPDLPPHLAPFIFEKIAINQANPALLQIIPGIGPELASRIIDKRDELGGFSSPEQLLEVRGVGQKRKEKLTAWLNFEQHDDT